MTVGELGSRMSSAEFSEWIEFESLEPFGAMHLEFIGGQVCSTVANVNRDPKHNPKPYAPDDFMPALNAEFTRNKKPVEAPELTEAQKAAFLDASFFGIAP